MQTQKHKQHDNNLTQFLKKSTLKPEYLGIILKNLYQISTMKPEHLGIILKNLTYSSLVLRQFRIKTSEG